MPLLEIIQTRQISASIRLDEATATQVDQYAAFIHATADDLVDKALNYVFSKDRDFQDFLKTSLAGQVAPILRSARRPLQMLPTCREKEGRRGGIHVSRRGEKACFPQIHFQESQRCCAPEEL